MGTTNNYRYVNASNVYDKGKSDGQNAGYGTYTSLSVSLSTSSDYTAPYTGFYRVQIRRPSNSNASWGVTRNGNLVAQYYYGSYSEFQGDQTIYFVKNDKIRLWKQWDASCSASVVGCWH